MNNKPLKRFGQNFLQDKEILKRISNVTNVENKNILEIGPGQGALTNYLIKKAKKVVAFEIDFNLVAMLKEKYSNYSNLEIIEKDFLKANLNEFKDFIIVANIPYYITTDIIFKIFEYNQNFDEVVLMVQKEFANRMCAKVNQQDYGKLSISTSFFYECKKTFDVPPSAFYPKPKVFSSIIHLKRKEQEQINAREFLKFINMCFFMKRKTLYNNLKNMNIDKKIFENFCLREKININSRPENLSLEEFIKLFKLIIKQK